MEKTPEEHIEKLVVGFREVRRVLRDDGVLFLNYGDKYGGGKRKSFDKSLVSRTGMTQRSAGLQRYEAAKDGDLLGLAWRLALALQADGWWLRSDTIWAKALSFCDTYSGSTMPESVNGWRWEQHRVTKCPNCGALGSFVKSICKKCAYNRKSGRGQENQRTAANKDRPQQDHDGKDFKPSMEWADCPGCPKCDPNDGLVLRKGSWRPTRAHEYLFIVTKTQNYYCDMEAVREEICDSTLQRDKYTRILENDGPQAVRHNHETPSNPSGRNLRDVWCINPQAYPDAHYATFPEALVEPCIKVATSEKGCCPECGAPWVRVVEKAFVGCNYGKRPDNPHISGSLARPPADAGTTPTTTLGWRPTCKDGKEPVPCIVLDPFTGSGTTLAVAARLKRDYIGIELNPDYIENQANYRVAEAETGITINEQKAGQKGLFL